MELIQDKMQDFMTYFHKETHYTIVNWTYNARAMCVNMEIWDEFHKVGIIAKCCVENLRREKYEMITKYLVAYMQREEINVYGGIR